MDTPSFLLIWTPVLFAFFAAAISLSFWNLFYQRVQPGFFYAISTSLLGVALLVGSFVGLIASVYINRMVFNYEILSAVLPSGIFLWYGFGPWLTPQFLSYWQYTILILFAAMLFLPYLNFRHLRRKQTLPN